MSISRLNASGGQVTVGLEIEAHFAAGFSEQVQDWVKRNASYLKFDQAGFEEE